MQLNPVQRRVLGVLIEKSMTTPGSYPLTVSALVAGCNQLTCRNPVMHLTEADVSRALYDLQQMLLVRQADPEPTARANRFLHQAEQRFGWDKRERAVMAELLLRGPQTVGELKQNASRMTPLEDLQVAANLLHQFTQHDPPFAVELPRQPGKSTARYDHRFYMDGEPREATTAPVAAPAAAAAPAPEPGRPAEGLEARVSRLEEQVAAITAQLDDLRRQLGA